MLQRLHLVDRVNVRNHLPVRNMSIYCCLWKSTSRRLWGRTVLIPVLLISIATAFAGRSSQDGHAVREGDTWTLGTAKVERKLVFQNGSLLTTSWINKTSGHELLTAGKVSEELRVVVDGKEVSSASGDWNLLSAQDQTLALGEIQLDITLQRGTLEATKTYVVYPGSSIIRAWVKFKNVGTTPIKITEPRFLNLTARLGSAESQDFYWMTGADNRPGSWMLRTEKLQPGKLREFDSYDPINGTAEGNYLGDGVIARILLNNDQIWPAKDWRQMKWGYTPNADNPVPIKAQVKVAAGDKLAFALNRFGTMEFDTTEFDPVITYESGEQHTASKEFSNEQVKNGWQYQYRMETTFENPDLARFYESRPLNHQSLQPLELVDLVYDASSKQWRKPGETKTEALFIGSGTMHPALLEDAVLVWIAPKAGNVRVSVTLANNANRPVPGGGRKVFMGSATYAPWDALMNRESGDGIFFGWDYFGHWASAFAQGADGAVSAHFKVAGHHQTLAPGESLTTPMAFSGLFMKDLDNAGNESLDWQYRYLWDYTREPWFPGVRQAGWWAIGTAWPDPKNPRVRGKGPLHLIRIDDADTDSMFRKVFRLADYLREVGADVYHRDCCWWSSEDEKTGGPDFRATGIYLRKYGMGQLIYRPIHLDISKPEPGKIQTIGNVDKLIQVVDGMYNRYGTFEYRTDGPPIAQKEGNDTPQLQEDHGFREILRHFLDKHPDSAFQACNGGGNEAGYDYVRYASSLSFSDGAVGIIQNYWASLILPPDKTAENGDFWEIDKYDKATYRGLLTMGFDNAGDSWDPEKLEGMRELIDIYHYLLSQGVVGRWVHVYRPFVVGDDPTMYFQRLSRDAKRAIIIPKRPAPGAVTIRPKGLNGAETYQVSFQESQASEQRTGADLMAKGIQLKQMTPGELIYLNLPYHPGNKLDITPPTAPSEARKAVGTNMGYPGVELRWKPGGDEHGVSYYEVLRDGTMLGKVAKGTFLFDHSAGADPAAKYEMCTVDRAGLRSRLIEVQGPSAQRALILDDAGKQGLSYNGKWRQQTGILPAYLGTLTASEEKGASFTIQFTGKKFTWFTKLGDHSGKAQVEVDGQPDAVVDTYSADDIWGVGIYTKEFPVSGSHAIKITVLGERGGPPDYGQGVAVYLDGLRIEGE